MKSNNIIKIENLNKKDKYVIRWNVTYLCNYSCDFCIQGNKKEHIKKSKNESIKTRKKICDNLISFIETELNKKYSYIELYLIGGEITALKDFMDLMKKLINCNFEGRISFVITTNLSLSYEKLEQLIKLFNVKRKNPRDLRLGISYYKEFANEEEFIEKLKLLSKYNKITNKFGLYKVYKRIKPFLKSHFSNKSINKIKDKVSKIPVQVGYPICTDEEYKEYLKFKKKYKKIIPNINFIIIKKYKTSISDKLKKKIVKETKYDKNIKVTFDNGKSFYCINNNNISLILEGEESFKSKGYLCDIGINNITISNEGIVSRCPSCKEKTIIGDMLNGNLKLPNDKILCPSTRCNCSFYNIIEKVSKNKE